MRRLLIALLTVASQWGLWLVYTNNVGYRELIAGCVGAIFSAAAAVLFAVQGKVAFRFRLRDAAQMVHLPWLVVSDTIKVLGAVGRQIFTRAGASSRIAAVPFDAGGQDALSAGRRALGISYTTITPNSVVLGVIPGDPPLLLYHQVSIDALPAMTCNLGARP